jgi:hypothetical protein
MTQLMTGTTWGGAGLAELNPESLEIGKPLRVLVRDSRGEATNISPHNSDGSVFWSPITQDNKLRGDLLARTKVGGIWVTNPEPNQGWLDTGQFKDGAGPQSKPNVRSTTFRVIQTNLPYYTSLTEESEALSFAPVDTALPWNQHLRKNLRLSNDNGDIIVPDPGSLNAGFSRVVSGVNPGRQFLVLRQIESSKTNLPLYKIDGYALARLSNIGNSKKEKDDSEASELTYDPELDGIMMALAPNGQGELEYQPILMHTWYGGSGWTALGGVPSLSATPPVATATTASHAMLAFAEPTGPGDPWTYTAQQSSDAGVTWGPAIEPDDVTVAGGTVTLLLAGLTAGGSKLRATVHATNGATATTPMSNSVTIT